MAGLKNCLQALWSLRDLLILVLTPIVFSPLLDGSSEGGCAYVLFLISVFWMFEVIPMGITAVIPVFLFPTLGVLSAGDTAAAYMKDSIFFVFGAFALALAIEKWNLHKRVALLTVLFIGTTTGAILLGLMLISFFLSMWMINTGTAALMVPIALGIAEEIGNRNSEADVYKLTKKSSECAVDNGGCANEVRDVDVAVTKDGGLEGSSVQSASRACILPSRSGEKTKKGFLLGVAYCALMGGSATLVGTPHVIYMAEFLEERYGSEAMDFGSWTAVALPSQFLCIFIGWIWLQWLFLDLKLADVRAYFSCGKKDEQGGTEDNGVKEYLRGELKSLGPVRFAEGTVLVMFIVLVLLWFFADPKMFPGWTSLDESGYISITISSVFATTLFFILPADPKKAYANFRADPTKKLEWERLLDPKSMQTKYPWMVVFLLVGCMYAVGEACEESGLSMVIAQKLSQLSHMEPSMVVFMISITVSVLCEALGNPSVVIIMLPILSDLAEEMEVNPLYFVIPMVLSASFAFMLPISSAPNIVAYSAGVLKVSDMVKSGCVMNLICMVLVNLTTHTLVVWVFDIYHYPDWAPLGNVTTPSR